MADIEPAGDSPRSPESPDDVPGEGDVLLVMVHGVLPWRWSCDAGCELLLHKCTTRP